MPMCGEARSSMPTASPWRRPGHLVSAQPSNTETHRPPRRPESILMVTERYTRACVQRTHDERERETIAPQSRAHLHSAHANRRQQWRVRQLCDSLDGSNPARRRRRSRPVLPPQISPSNLKTLGKLGAPDTGDLQKILSHRLGPHDVWLQALRALAGGRGGSATYAGQQVAGEYMAQLVHRRLSAWATCCGGCPPWRL